MRTEIKTVLITGANGFIGKNLSVTLKEKLSIKVLTFNRDDSIEKLSSLVNGADFIFHLAGENRPDSPTMFDVVNRGLTEELSNILLNLNKSIPIILTSSSQAVLGNPYGASKLAAEDVLRKLSKSNRNPIIIYRLPGVFGKWCKPNYNSVVATFCHNVAHGLPIEVNNPNITLDLVYIDDVINSFILQMEDNHFGVKLESVTPQYHISVGDLASKINAFELSRSSLISERVGMGLMRALYSTYVSYLPADKFSYGVEYHEDARGIFVEMLKTRDSGQFSFFTALPGVTRGGHYHHTKTEKFMVIKGQAKFCFRHILTDEEHILYTSEESFRIVETAPGWSHSVTNVGNDDLVALIWANEIFSKQHPDTVSYKV